MVLILSKTKLYNDPSGIHGNKRTINDKPAWPVILQHENLMYNYHDNYCGDFSRSISYTVIMLRQIIAERNKQLIIVRQCYE